VAACANTTLHAVSEDSSANVMVVAIAAVPVVLWFNVGNDVRLAADPLAGVPNTGVIKVGLVANTNDPLPVSSEIAVANSAEDPVNVLSVKSILLFVNVVVELAVTAFCSPVKYSYQNVLILIKTVGVVVDRSLLAFANNLISPLLDGLDVLFRVTDPDV